MRPNFKAASKAAEESLDLLVNSQFEEAFKHGLEALRNIDHAGSCNVMGANATDAEKLVIVKLCLISLHSPYFDSLEKINMSRFKLGIFEDPRRYYLVSRCRSFTMQATPLSRAFRKEISDGSFGRRR
jgi:hypothetical protein